MKNKTVKELEAEIQRLEMLNQALTDELDAIYEHQGCSDMMFDEFLGEEPSPYKGQLH